MLIQLGHMPQPQRRQHRSTNACLPADRTVYDEGTCLFDVLTVSPRYQLQQEARCTFQTECCPGRVSSQPIDCDFRISGAFVVEGSDAYSQHMGSHEILRRLLILTMCKDAADLINEQETLHLLR
jgi:hypothetical protein